MWKPVLFLFAALPVFAQWPDSPGKNVPMKNGKPDLEAPAPKTAWGKTDFSGLWENIRPALKGDPPTATFAKIGRAHV